MIPPLTVLIVDDHFVVRSGLTAALEVEDDVKVVGEAKRGDEALEAYRLRRPGVVLMDLQLPGLSGVQATAVLRAHDPQARILVYSTFAHDDEVQMALDAGARLRAGATAGAARRWLRWTPGLRAICRKLPLATNC